MAVEVSEGHAWLKSLAAFGIRPGLGRTREVLYRLGNPEQGLRFYHVAGTNGKGSVCAYLTEILSVRQLTGTFTSPTFDGYYGRIIVAGQPISAVDLERLAIRVRDVVTDALPTDPLTEFEAITCIACLYFKEQGVEAVVWETGLGGRFDSTNVVDPTVTAITNVGLDHTQILGPSVWHIAHDKSGIIKRERPIVTAATGEALSIIMDRARLEQAPSYVSGNDFMSVRRFTANQYYVDYRGMENDWYGLPLVLFGSHQAENAGIALAMVELAAVVGATPRLSVSEMRLAMQQVRWPGRFEVLTYRNHDVVLDGAHNPDAARRLARSLAEWRMVRRDKANSWTFVVGVLADKDYCAMLRAVFPLVQQIVTVAPDNSRALPATDLADVIRTMHADVRVVAAQSVTEGLNLAANSEGPICCMGSLYTVDEARKAIQYSVK